MDNEYKKMYKVVYFDEESAGDYLNIADKGITKQNTEKSTNKQVIRSLAIKTRLSLVFSATTLIAIVTGLAFSNYILRVISGILGVIAAIANMTPITLDFLRSQNREDKELTSTQVTSTILSQFLEKQEKERQDEKEGQIICIRPTSVQIEENSFSFIKFYEPMLKMITLNLEGIDMSKFGDVMKEAKGYYELKANMIKNPSGEENYYILRLNAETFRNNYKLTDLLHMGLTYYGIKVGKMSLDEMDVQHMLNIKEKSSITPQQAYSAIKQEKSISEVEAANKNREYDIIDVILAGVGEYEEN